MPSKLAPLDQAPSIPSVSWKKFWLAISLGILAAAGGGVVLALALKTDLLAATSLVLGLGGAVLGVGCIFIIAALLYRFVFSNRADASTGAKSQHPLPNPLTAGKPKCSSTLEVTLSQDLSLPVATVVSEAQALTTEAIKPFDQSPHPSAAVENPPLWEQPIPALERMVNYVRSVIPELSEHAALTAALVRIQNRLETGENDMYSESPFLPRIALAFHSTPFANIKLMMEADAPTLKPQTLLPHDTHIIKNTTPRSTREDQVQEDCCIAVSFAGIEEQYGAVTIALTPQAMAGVPMPMVSRSANELNAERGVRWAFLEPESEDQCIEINPTNVAYIAVRLHSNAQAQGHGMPYDEYERKHGMTHLQVQQLRQWLDSKGLQHIPIISHQEAALEADIQARLGATTQGFDTLHNQRFGTTEGKAWANSSHITQRLSDAHAPLPLCDELLPRNPSTGQERTIRPFAAGELATTDTQELDTHPGAGTPPPTMSY